VSWAECLAGLLGREPVHLISVPIKSDMPGQRVLHECWASADSPQSLLEWDRSKSELKGSNQCLTAVLQPPGNYPPRVLGGSLVSTSTPAPLKLCLFLFIQTFTVPALLQASLHPGPLMQREGYARLNL